MIYVDILISCSLAAVLKIYTQHFYTSSSFAQQNLHTCGHEKKTRIELPQIPFAGLYLLNLRYFFYRLHHFFHALGNSSFIVLGSAPSLSYQSPHPCHQPQTSSQREEKLRERGGKVEDMPAVTAEGGRIRRQQNKHGPPPIYCISSKSNSELFEESNPMSLTLDSVPKGLSFIADRH